MRLARQLPVLLLACFAISCGAAYESDSPYATSAASDSISVGANSAASTAVSADANAKASASQASERQASERTASAKASEAGFERSRPVKVAPFPLVLNQTAKNYVTAFTDHAAALNSSFDRSAPYLGEMKKMLEERGVPSDFVYLAFAESEFSKWGAGPWQLTKSTARRFGLRVNDYVDERRDPIKSTRVAAEYLAHLHDQLDDWRLAVVGWNTGEKSILQFIDSKGMDYERMASSLPRRTRALLDRFMAVAFIAHHANEYGIQDAEYSTAPHYDHLTVRGGTTLVSAAKLAHTTPDMIRMLNPALLRDRVPPGDSKYELIVPHLQPLGSKL